MPTSTYCMLHYSWNKKSLSIGYVGKFDQMQPPRDAIEAGPVFIQWLVDTGDFYVHTFC